ncbi:MAG: signal peptidase II [Archangium gephyra]|uniref:Lipoprotein signal peptidase n=1 Tax=Archangium gephyra TaxID=48 RepID=A0A2W5T226_9BACT|nr:MAG: signal peptidase II [Archangium gephyra]
MAQKYGWLLIAAAIVVTADQLSKFMVLSRLTTAFDGDASALGTFYGRPPEPSYDGLRFRPKDRVVFAGGFLTFTYAENDGAAFGLFRNVPRAYRAPLFYAVTLGALLLVFYYWRQLRGGRDERFARVGLPLLLGGALGNAIDRLTRGFVIDFLDVHRGDLHWPAFNVADVTLVVGVMFLLVDSFVRREPKK